MADLYGSNACKYLIIILNAIFFIVGLCLAGVAGYGAFNKNSELHQLVVSLHNPIPMTGLQLLMAVGLILAVVAILGCFGAARESNVLLGIYFVLILVIFILELTATILCYTKFQAVKGNLLYTMKHSHHIHEQEKQVSLSVLIFLNKLETEKHCCGVYGPSDYDENIPQSCYHTTVLHLHEHDEEDGHNLLMDGPSASNGELSSRVEQVPGGSLAQTSGGQPAYATNAGAVVTQASMQTHAAMQTQAAMQTNAPMTQAEIQTQAAMQTNAAVTAQPTMQQEIFSTARTLTTKAAEITTQQSNVAPQSTSSAQPTTSTPGIPDHVLHHELYQQGCLTKLKPFISVAAGITITLMILQLIVLVFTGCLFSHIKGGYSRLS